MGNTRILLVGTNKPQVNDFFSLGKDTFECLSCSMREDDMTSHLNLIDPKALICCLNVEKDQELYALDKFTQTLRQKDIPVIIMGTKEGVSRYKKLVAFPPTLDFGDKFIPPRTLFQEIQTCINESGHLHDALVVKKHILVVDDDPLMLKVIKEALHEEYNVAAALGGKTALKFLETKSTDLILLDYEMPELNGVQVLERLRMDDKTSGIPVIFLTGNRDPEKVKEVLSYKPRGYVLKPVDSTKLHETIKKVFE